MSNWNYNFNRQLWVKHKELQQTPELPKPRNGNVMNTISRSNRTVESINRRQSMLLWSSQTWTRTCSNKQSIAWLLHSNREESWMILPRSSKTNSTQCSCQLGTALWDVASVLTWPTRRNASSLCTGEKSAFCSGARKMTQQILTISPLNEALIR